MQDSVHTDVIRSDRLKRMIRPIGVTLVRTVVSLESDWFKGPKAVQGRLIVQAIVHFNGGAIFAVVQLDRAVEQRQKAHIDQDC